MKKIKYIISIFCFLLVFILTSELYQNYLSNFMDDFYYFSVGEQNDSTEVYDLVAKLSNENNIGVFLVDYKTETTYSAKLDVYMNQKAKEELETKYNISDGIYKSLFSGNSEIHCYDYEELYTDGENLKFYFIGDFEQIRDVRNTFNETIAAGYIHKNDSNTISWLIIAVWIVVLLCIIVLTWLDIQFQKKENFIRISLGMQMRKIVIKNIALDTIVYLGLFLVIYFLMSQFVYIGFKRTTILLMFVILLICNSLLYLSLFKYEYKEVLLGANINLKIISNCYILKVFTMMITIVSLSVNLELVTENSKYLKMYDTINQYDEYSFLTLDMGKNDGDDWEEQAKIHTGIKSKVFYEFYSFGKVALSVYNTENEYGDRYFLVNENTVGIEELIQKYCKEDNKYYIFIPKGKENIPKDAYEITMCKFSGFVEEMDYEVVVYDSGVELLFFDTSISSDLIYGFDKYEQPVMIYPCFDDDNINVNELCDIFGHCENDIMYRLSEEDINYIEENYEIDNINVISVTERCEQYKASISRIVLLNSVISIFMFALEMTIIVTVIRMEYVVKAKELALKKVLGYGIWKKNWQLILLNIMTAGISVITLVIFSKMFKMFDCLNIILSTMFLLVVELILIVGCVLRTEKQYVPQILKGGCL